MKKCLLWCELLMLLLPICVFAKYNSTNLDEALNDEVIKHDLSLYKETDDQVIIYLFRGTGCPHCRAFLEFLKSIVPEYGKYFKLESYQIWKGEEDNKQLLRDVAIHMGYNPDSSDFGIPFIIIGKKVFDVYNSNYDDEIIKAIMEEYQNDNRYDVLIDMKIKKPPFKINYTILFNVICSIAIVSSLVVGVINLKNYRKINNRIDNIEKLLKRKEVK